MERLHFWYSEKQSRVDDQPMMRMLRAMAPELPRSRCWAFVEIGGELISVEYTECNRREEYRPNWDDAIYLGEGIIDRIEMDPVHLQEEEW